MSLLTSLYTGATGLNAESTEMSIIGDNIANANTIGFKEGRAQFSDVLGQSLIGGGGQLGFGTRVSAVQNLMAQGAIATTGISTDLALDGNGFFIVKQGDGTEAYTRAGQFTIDQNGFLVNLQGARVQGFGADQTGAVGGSLGDLQFSDATSPPNATTKINMKGNLDSSTTIQGAFDLTQIGQPGGPTPFTSTTVYDSLGGEHQVDIYVNKTADGQWEYHAVTDGKNQTGGVAGTPVEIASGTLSFDTDGKLVDVTPISSSFLPPGATQPQALDFNFGDPTAAGGTGLAGVTQFAQTTASSFVGQDGFGAGTLSRVSIGEDGKITGVFSNGQIRVIGEVAVATFKAPDKMDRVGNTLLIKTAESGEPNVGHPNTGGRGRIAAGALEQSNVDLSEELIRMIVAQRSFQANSKTLSTSDQMLAELMQVK